MLMGPGDTGVKMMWKGTKEVTLGEGVYVPSEDPATSLL